jgi:hypothetical protein
MGRRTIDLHVSHLTIIHLELIVIEPFQRLGLLLLLLLLVSAGC